MRALTCLVLSLLAGVAHACQQASNPARLALAGGSLTEIVYFLGEEQRIVATDRTSNYPPEAVGKPSVGYVRNLSTEGLLSLNPSLVLGEDDMGPPAVLEQVAAAGVDIVMIPEQHSAEGIIAKVRCVASVLGVSDRAERIIEARLSGDLESLEQIAEASNGRKPRVAVLLGLRDGVPLGAGADTSAHGLIEMAGGENVLASFDGWRPISIEAMVEADPDVFVVPSRGVDDAGGTNALLAHPGLKLTRAASEGKLIAMDGMAMLGFGPRTLATAVALNAEIDRLTGSSAATGGD
ncbi:MAG: ABC transporter substrate-binding protein [Pseudomonadota bacterium]